MQQHQRSAALGIDEARRVLGNVFAPWVQDLNLSVEAIDYEQRKDIGVDWQPGATLRWPFPSGCAGMAALSAGKH